VPCRSSGVAQLSTLGCLCGIYTMNDLILSIVRQLQTEVLAVIGLIGCIAAACIFRKRAPSASLYAILACSIKLMLLIAFPIAWWCVQALDLGANSLIRTLWSYGWSAADALCTILLVFAVYVGRRQPHKKLGV